MQKTIIIAIVGKSCTGKDTLKQNLYQYYKQYYNTNVIINCTTRPPRAEEKNGENYWFFYTRKQFFNQSLIIWNKYRNWYYGIARGDIKNDSINIGVFTLKSLRQLQRRYQDDYTIIPIYLEEKLSTRIRRMFNRDNGFHFEYIRRLFTDHWDFKNFKPSKRWIYLKNIDNQNKQLSLCITDPRLGNFL